MKYVELSGWVARGYALKEVTKKELLAKSGGSAAVFNGLVEKKVFEVYHQEIGRLDKGCLLYTSVGKDNSFSVNVRW